MVISRFDMNMIDKSEALTGNYLLLGRNEKKHAWVSAPNAKHGSNNSFPRNDDKKNEKKKKKKSKKKKKKK